MSLSPAPARVSPPILLPTSLLYRFNLSALASLRLIILVDFLAHPAKHYHDTKDFELRFYCLHHL